MNKVELMGRLTKDPEIRYTQTSNTPVANFTLAVNRRWKKDTERQADFINIVAWNKTAEFVSKYFQKGLQVIVIGRMENDSYENSKGEKVYKTNVIAEEVFFAESKKEQPEQETNEVVEEDDLPF